MKPSIEDQTIGQIIKNDRASGTDLKSPETSVLENRQCQPDAKAIDQLVQRIVKIVHPLKIILFGSAARGEMGPDSDIDVLVVMPEGVHRRRTAQLLYREIRGLGIPFDILVATPGDLEKHKNNIGLIYQTILREGKEVYKEEYSKAVKLAGTVIQWAESILNPPKTEAENQDTESQGDAPTKT